ncbi:Krueppel factor 11 [Fasciolopsis buskii]|uniref:Krueppel factor 11 n=1 Tax=Fasciolopsis buskii TaxID=27845 RepID=A0A8E0RYA3_9TREM|nr:Krueppel factor 11 [Fasciolopsis buski]
MDTPFSANTKKMPPMAYLNPLNSRPSSVSNLESTRCPTSVQCTSPPFMCSPSTVLTPSPTQGGSTHQFPRIPPMSDYLYAAAAAASLFASSRQLSSNNRIPVSPFLPPAPPIMPPQTTVDPVLSNPFHGPTSIGANWNPVHSWDPAILYLAAATQLVLRYLSLPHSSLCTTPSNPTINPNLPTPQSGISGPVEFSSNSSPSTSFPVNSVIANCASQRSTQTANLVTTGTDLTVSSNATQTSCPVVCESSSPTAFRRTESTNSCGCREKRYRCTYPGCSKAYYKRSHLNEHFHLHTGMKPHLCIQPGCGARFTRADQLSRHRRAHTGERNFFCTTCQKRFKRSDHLKVHLARNVCTRLHSVDPH